MALRQTYQSAGVWQVLRKAWKHRVVRLLAARSTAQLEMQHAGCQIELSFPADALPRASMCAHIQPSHVLDIGLKDIPEFS